MGASVEKWAHPQWTHPLLESHSGLAMGLDRSFYMIAAGVVEFSLAFALIWTPLIRRLAAVALSFMFVGAIFEFGKIDAVGHLMIILILLAIAVDGKVAAKRNPVLAPAYYCAALAAFICMYYGAHALIFGTANL
jgi:hypothetical protein